MVVNTGYRGAESHKGNGVDGVLEDLVEWPRGEELEARGGLLGA